MTPVVEMQLGRGFRGSERKSGDVNSFLLKFYRCSQKQSLEGIGFMKT